MTFAEQLKRNIIATAPVIRSLIGSRLRWLPFSRREAAMWSRLFSNHPTLFEDFGYDIQKTVAVFPGISMRLGIRERVERALVCHGIWEPHVTAATTTLLKAGDTFIDVGANIGYFTFLASTIVGPMGTVFAFEPSIRALSTLVKHLECNSVKNVVVCSVGLSDRLELTKLYRSNRANIGRTALRRVENERENVEMVITQRLDDLLPAFDVAPKLIKIDIEGAELRALKGMQQTLTNHQPYVIAELCNEYLSDMGSSVAKLQEFMFELGYRAFVASKQHDSTKWRPMDALNELQERTDVLFARRKVPESMISE